MVFSSLTFLYVFLPVVLGAYFVLPQRFRNLFILISGLVFYAWGEPFYVFLMLLSSLVDYLAGLAMWKFDKSPAARKVALVVSVLVNITLLGTFKYSGFIIENLNAVLGTAIPNPNLPLPIGISFFTFQSMSYTIDLYMRNIKVQKNPITFAAFVSLFPQVVAGPIVRYNDIARELDSRSESLDLIYDGIVQFMIGLGKKVLIANSIGSLWSAVKLMEMGTMSMLTAWLGILAFTFQIYFDFSGYSDMAIGMGKILGFNFPKNFDHPYMSRSISEFWRRWHITLGSWFKSYVYFPLGGSRKGTGRTVLNLAIVWLLTGIWHGASWNFIVWGCLYGVVIILEKLFLGKLLARLPSALSWAYTMLLVILGWVLFDTADLTTAFRYIGVMFGSTGIVSDSQGSYQLLNYGIMMLICAFACTDLWSRLSRWLTAKIPAVMHYAIIPAQAGMLMLCTAYLVDASYNPFLYFNF